MSKTVRIASIDIFRALTMLLMIFVNDFASLSDTIPHWLHHAAFDEDMLGLSDVVFPCFLFCVGLSIPFAIQNRIAKGENRTQQICHIMQRSIALLVMGLFSANSFVETGKLIGVSHHWLKLISIAAFFMIWNVYPRAQGTAKKIFSALQTFGWAILVALALIFFRKAPTGESSFVLGFIPIGFSGSARYIFQYIIIAICCVFPIISAYKRSNNQTKMWISIAVFVAIFYLFLFKGANADGLVGLRPGWWQILGLIGWTYLYTAVIFVFTRNSIVLNFIAWCAFTFLCIAANLGWLGAANSGFHNFIPGNGTFQSLAFAGVIASLTMQQNSGKQKFKSLSINYSVIAVIMFVAGIIAHRFFIISKLQETCTWVFYCLAISFACLLFIHWLTDIKGKKHYFDIIKPAGTATLTCYIMPTVWYAVIALAAIKYPAWATSGYGGLLRSAIFSFVIIGITWLIGKLGLKLKI